MAVCQWHEARKTCLLVNRDRKSKNKIFLPLGRHSIMNGLAIPVELEKEHFDLAAQTLIAFTESTQALEDWCVTRSKYKISYLVAPVE